MATYRLTIDNWRPATLNRLMRGKIRTRIKLSEIDKNMVCAYAIHHRIPRALGRRRVDLLITLKGRDKEADVDAYWKSTLDSLVNAGMLIDDHRAYCELGDVTFNRGERRSTTISLTDL
jgi:Holliday junction resolvase RusA-like endonuclease